MHARSPRGPGEKKSSLLALGGRLVLLLLPVTLLLICSLRGTSVSPRLLWLGTLFQFLACALAFLSGAGWRESMGSTVIMLYVIALSWMLLGAAGSDDWFLHLTDAILLVVPLLHFAMQCLLESGARPAPRPSSRGSSGSPARLANQSARLPDAARSESAA